MFALQEALARAIVAALPISGHAIPASLVQAPTSALDAYTLYLRGRYAALKRTVEGLTLGVEYFEQAIEKDPGYVLAYAGLAECWALRGFGEFGDLDPNVAMPRARAAATEALRLDPKSSQAHTWLGVVHFLFDWDWTAAEHELQEALHHQRDNAYAQLWYAVLLAQLRQHDESLRRIHLAESLEPMSTAVRLTMARCYYYARRYQEALENLQGMWRAEPGDRLVAMWLARTLACMGRHAEALEALESVTAAGRQLLGLNALRSILLFGAGRTDDARALARETLERVNKERAPYSSSFTAVALYQLGDTDAAFEVLRTWHADALGIHAVRRRAAVRSAPT